MTCPRCGGEVAPNEAFCTACGTRVGVPVTEQIAEQRRASATTRARHALLACAVIIAGTGVMGALTARRALNDPAVANQTLFVYGLLSALFFGMWWWARRNVIAAVLVALVVFVTVGAVGAVADPSSLMDMYYFKGAFVVALVTALHGALEARRLKGLTGAR